MELAGYTTGSCNGCQLLEAFHYGHWLERGNGRVSLFEFQDANFEGFSSRTLARER